MDKRLREVFEMKTMTPIPCEKCRNKYLKKGVMLINPETCSLVVIKDRAYHNLFEGKIPEKRIAFCDEAVVKKITQMGEEADKKEAL